MLHSFHLGIKYINKVDNHYTLSMMNTSQISLPFLYEIGNRQERYTNKDYSICYVINIIKVTTYIVCHSSRQKRYKNDWKMFKVLSKFTTSFLMSLPLKPVPMKIAQEACFKHEDSSIPFSFCGGRSEAGSSFCSFNSIPGLKSTCYKL